MVSISTETGRVLRPLIIVENKSSRLKNEHLNDIYVSDIHAAFLVNKGKGSSQDVLGLIDLIKKTVKDKFGVKLKEEIFYLK